MHKVFSIRSILLSNVAFLGGMIPKPLYITKQLVALHQQKQAPADALVEIQGKCATLTTPIILGIYDPSQEEKYSFSHDPLAQHIKEVFEITSGTSCIKAVENNLYSTYFYKEITLDNFTRATYPYLQPIIIKNRSTKPSFSYGPTGTYFLQSNVPLEGKSGYDCPQITHSFQGTSFFPIIAIPQLAPLENIVIRCITEVPARKKIKPCVPDKKITD